ncbi:hypothetical protein PQX77_003661 [Marasmius sp. AFHP31]|nr:hypothetical protein PQX77_003661 [Marasmius sp. AFHP31]
MELASTSPYACHLCGHVVDERTTEKIPSSSCNFEAFSKCNDSPSLLELGMFESERQHLAKLQASLDLEIARLRTSLELIEEKRRQVGTSMWFCKSAQHPIRRLPNEILAEIFNFCVEGDVNIVEGSGKADWQNDGPSTLDLDQTLWALSQVCQRWRNLALSSPKLWTAININWVVRKEKPEIDLMRRRLALTLERSRDQPLYISWFEGYSLEPALLRLLGSCSARWKCATIRASTVGFHLLALTTTSFTTLSRLRLYFEEDSDWLDEEEGTSEFSLWEDAPALTKVYLASSSDIHPHLETLVPWEQIRDLTLVTNDSYDRDLIEWPDLHEILPLAGNIHKCFIQSFSFDHDLSHIHSLSVPFTLAHLRSLKLIAASSPNSIAAFLDSVTLPALTVLQAFPLEADGIQSTVTRFLSRSACTLVTLGLMGINDGTLIELLNLREIQGVRELLISGPRDPDTGHDRSVSDDVVTLLRRANTTPDPLQPNRVPEVLFPGLKKIYFAGLRRWTERTLVDMVASRRAHLNPDACLGRVTLMEVGDFVFEDETAVGAMKELIAGGLVLRESKGKAIL